jgi:hypothetical protein
MESRRRACGPLRHGISGYPARIWSFHRLNLWRG